MDVTVWLDFRAVHRAAHRPAAVEQPKAAGQVDAGERRSPLALPGLDRELQEGNLYPVIGCDGQQASNQEQGQADKGG